MDLQLKNILMKNIHNGKNLKNLDLEYISNKLKKYFLREGFKRKQLEEKFFKNKLKIEKSKIFKLIVKEIREEIGQVYGQFLTKDFKKKENFLNVNIEKNNKIINISSKNSNSNNSNSNNSNSNNVNLNKSNFNNVNFKNNKFNLNTILKLHKSTRERLDFYSEIYDKIFDWYKPKLICDLACGLNPISYGFIKEKLNYSPGYFSSDLGYKDMEFLNLYFKKLKINGIAKSFDLTNLDFLVEEKIEKADLIFLFKALDSLERIKKNISKEILEKLPSKRIIVSFPTKSLISKKEIKKSKREWFVKFIKFKGWNLDFFEVENEIFYLINKNSNDKNLKT